MFFIGHECVACRRAHPGAHDRACLDDPSHLHVTKATPPAEGGARWWITPPPDPQGRILDRWSLIEAMSAATWTTFAARLPSAEVTFASTALQDSGWRLHAFTRLTRPRALRPYRLLGITHIDRAESRRTFWLAERDRSAHPVAVELRP
ncbi:hypothetical protein [Phytomonospora endophytica]|uniref:Uncharacterized protein n=1 Tax=Phytomonospora endophytica TaxID=714109 RepID=A0A841G346_9ACTN|nr:hypothetical protein [Phytomonospora endophytica]MBB6038540.1 hypothetical protein [Phytomonospora endophytica]GIG69320.1 hypothetical protein Pen01_56150 [Phytomonospora endophytica]